jgi:hypothetical protein
MISNLCSKQEIPDNSSTGVGAGLLTIDRRKTLAHIEVVTTGLSGGAVAGHIHYAAKGVNGPVIVNLGITGANNNQASGILTIPRTTFADSLSSGNVYFNVHTAANTGGEIRGQIAKDIQSECSLATGISEIGGEKLAVKVYPNPMYDQVNLTFDSPEGFTAQIVVSDLIGRQHLAQKTAVFTGANQVNLDVNELPAGIYLVQIRNSNAILFTGKVVKE